MWFRSVSIYLIAFCLGLLAGHSFGELFMIRQTPQRIGDPYNLTCVTKDLRAAFVWNDDLQNSGQPEDTVPMQPEITQNRTLPGQNDLILDWRRTRAWHVVNSATNPMSPVFDSRWEEFSQFSFPRDDLKNEYQYVRDLTESGTLVFSARGLGDINVRLCVKDKLSSANSCFWITIPAWPNTTSVIRSCLHRETENGELSQDLCDNEIASYKLSNRSVIDASEWRTFALRWNTNYSQLKSYSDVESNFSKEFKISKNVNHLFVQSSAPGHIRFHSYDYLLTEEKNAVLSYVPFLYGDSNYCIALTFSLCIECELLVRFIFTSNNKIYEIFREVYGSRNFVDGELPTWQVVKLDSFLEKLRGRYVGLEIISTMKGNHARGWWAIDSLRKCDSVGLVRTSTRTFGELSNRTFLALPVLRCQQLSYSRNIVISSNALMTQKIPTGLPKCTNGRVGPTCKFYCTNSCKGTSICDQSDCICAPGFMGSHCSTECPDGRHGYNCQETCGSCESGKCDKRTGICDSNCKDYYLPPHCEIEVKAPGVSDVTATTAILHYMKLNAKSTKNIFIQMKTTTGPWEIIPANWARWDTPWIYRYPIKNLSPETLYILRAVVRTRDGLKVTSPESSFTTKCELPIITSNWKTFHRGNGSILLIYDPPLNHKWSITAFGVYVKRSVTRLRNRQLLNSPGPKYYPVEQCLPYYYCATLYLSTSTTYYLRVQIINSCGCSQWTNVNLTVPASLGFASKEKLQVTRNGNSINLKLPSVINDTLNTVMTVVVKGSPTCTSSSIPDDMRRRVNLTQSEDGWIAASFPNLKSRPEYLPIGKDPNDDSSENCSLDPEQTYVIMVDVVDQVDNKSAVITSLPIYMPSVEARGSNLVWLIFPFILLICLFLLFIWRRKCLNALTQVHRQNLVSCSQIFTNFVKSTTTCTSQQTPACPLSAELELSENIGTRAHVSWNRYSRSVNIQDFEDYVKASIASGLLQSQFQMLPRGKNRPFKYGALPENMPKNRYNDIIAYDNSRVVLKKTPDDPYSDYINANYIQGFRKKRAYIATQGPKPQTVVDFWRMVWQEEALIICMLTNIIEGPKVKCEQYWPEIGSSKTYGDIIVVTENHHVLSDYTLRIFQVSCNEESRKIVHLHYTGWPDHAVPMYPNSVISYLKRLQTIPSGQGPIIVHCSAGVGRTGAIILCDICLRRALNKGTLDVLAEFKKLRDCRMNMVDTERQYIFVHVVLTECFVSPLTDLKCNNNLPQAINELRKKLPQHIERLRNTTWQDEALHPQMSSRSLPAQPAKNRFPELAPVSTNLVYLERYPTHVNNSDYISAVIVDGLRVKKQYLTSQLPLPSTLSDFWRLIAEQRIELVIVLQQPDSNDPTCCDIIPVENPINPVPFINVELKTDTDQETSPDVIELLLTDTSRVGARTQEVTFLTCPGWGLGKNGKPPTPDKLIELWMTSKNIRRDAGPTLVLCHDGITGCGLYLALSFLLERMAVERKCDIIFSVKAIRQFRPNFVQSQEQFEYLCDAAVKYIEFFEMYTNFA